MIDVVDAIRDLLEPPSDADESVSVNGIAIDRTCAMPFEFRPETIYAAEASDVRTLEETMLETAGGTIGVERQTFGVTLLYVVDGEGENAELRRSRAVSIRLDAKRNEWLRKVREHRIGPVWDHLQGSSDVDFVRQLQVRGIAVRLTGWRFVG